MIAYLVGRWKPTIANNRFRGNKRLFNRLVCRVATDDPDDDRYSFDDLGPKARCLRSVARS